MLLITIILIFISFFIVTISLLTSADSKAFSGALVGSTDLDLFNESKERGTKKWLARGMFLLGILLFALSLVLKIYVK